MKKCASFKHQPQFIKNIIMTKILLRAFHKKAINIFFFEPFFTSVAESEHSSYCSLCFDWAHDPDLPRPSHMMLVFHYHPRLAQQDRDRPTWCWAIAMHRLHTVQDWCQRDYCVIHRIVMQHWKSGRSNKLAVHRLVKHKKQDDVCQARYDINRMGDMLLTYSCRLEYDSSALRMSVLYHNR